MAGKKPIAKDWYWEAEQDKIASDMDLLLIRSPDDWPAEGLECVGLWFLMLNLMAKSVRKGYLLDPADDRKPMSATELAVLTGRSAAVVSRIQAVILQRGLFSQNEDGIIYSRGMVRKEELRKKRAKSGKKGGLRTQDLLKQNVKQNTKQTLGIGIELTPNSSSMQCDFAQANAQAKPSEDPPPGKYRDAAVRVAFVYASHMRGRRMEDVTERVDAFEAMLEMGVPEEYLTRDLKRRPPDRDRSEQLWQIKKRAFDAFGIKDKAEPRPPSKGEIEQAARNADYIKLAREQAARRKETQ